jgi:hypothetical protein
VHLLNQPAPHLHVCCQPTCTCLLLFVGLLHVYYYCGVCSVINTIRLCLHLHLAACIFSSDLAHSIPRVFLCIQVCCLLLSVQVGCSVSPAHCRLFVCHGAAVGQLCGACFMLYCTSVWLLHGLSVTASALFKQSMQMESLCASPALCMLRDGLQLQTPFSGRNYACSC